MEVYAPQIRIANPEVTVTQLTPFKVEQDKPFKVEQDKPFKVEQDKQFIAPPELPNSDRKEANAAANGHVGAAEQRNIQRSENRQSARVFRKKHNARVK